MNWDDYQLWTVETAMYPGAGTGGPEAIVYCALGLSGELFELGGAIYQVQREDTPEARVALLAELGDCVYYLARLYAECLLRRQDSKEGTHAGYLTLAGVAAFVPETVKKCLRRGGPEEVAKLVGDAVFRGRLDAVYESLCVHAKDFGWTMEQVTDANREKLESRKARGKLEGSGDKR